jgi:protein subunit release factor B
MDHPYLNTQTMNLIRALLLAAGIREEDLEERFILGSGAGGQKINKTSSAVSLRHVPSGLFVKIQASRSREVNRWMARRTLAERLLAQISGVQTARQQEAEKIRRQKRRKSRRQRARMVADKRHQSAIKAGRGAVRGSDE